MNKDCEMELKAATSLNEMWNALDKYYNLDEPFGLATGNLAKKKIINNLDEVVSRLHIRERNRQKFY